VTQEQTRVERPEWEKRAKAIQERLGAVNRRFFADPSNSKEHPDLKTLSKICKRICDFRNAVEERYGAHGAGRHRLFSALLLSSPVEECTELDFPGGDSVELFVQQLEKEFGGTP